MISYILTNIFVQVVYNANKLAELVKKKKKLQNWLDYYQLKYSRNSSNRPTMKVLLYNLIQFLFPKFCHILNYVAKKLYVSI